VIHASVGDPVERDAVAAPRSKSYARALVGAPPATGTVFRMSSPASGDVDLGGLVSTRCPPAPKPVWNVRHRPVCRTVDLVDLAVVSRRPIANSVFLPENARSTIDLAGLGAKA
jgi:hypothetical protein